MTTLSDGTPISELRYTAYGEERYASGDTPTGYRYTGQLSKMDTTGLYYYGVRWYDPAIMAFASADTLIPDASNPLDWNRYAYARGNSIRYTDPTGHAARCADGDEGGGCGSSSPKALLALKTIDTQKAVRDYVRAHPHYHPEFDPAVQNDRTAYSEVAIAMMQVSQEGNGSPEHWHNFYSGTSMKLQDFALGASAAGSTMEILGLSGLGLEGAAIGNGLHQAITNPIETVASWGSTSLTIADDFVTGQNNLAKGKMGEATATSLVLSSVGSFIPIASVDVVIDGYASAYNHGNAPGVYTIYNTVQAFLANPLKIIR